MLARRLLIARGGGGVVLPPSNYSLLYNGQNGSGIVKVGLATSVNAGATWTRYAGNPVMTVGAGGQWDDEQVHAPTVFWDGSQWVMFFDGYSGSEYAIGRATSPDLITWTKYGSNPILSKGTAGAFDDQNVNFPFVRYDNSLSPAWQMWYAGWKSGGKITLGYADSTDGLAWTKRGQVLAEGTAGAFDDEGMATGPVVKVGATYYVFYAGQADTGGSTSDYRTGYATCTNPASSGTYTKQGVLSQFSTTLTSLDDGLTYTSNGLVSIVLRGSTYIGYGTAFQPVSPATQHEVSFRSTSTDLITWTTPTGVLLPLSGGTYDTISAENPSVVQA